MAFKMKGFNAGKGTGMSPNTMKKGSAMKMKKGSSMKKPLVGDQHKLPQELKAQIKQAPMTLGMRGNAMQGRDPNAAMKASNAMMPGSMMAMKKQNSAMTLKQGGSVSGAKSMKDKVAASQGKPKFKTKSNISVGTKKSARRKAELSTGKTADPKTRRGTGAKFDIKKAAAEKAKQKKFDKMPSPMTLEKGMAAGTAISGVAGRKRTGDPERRLSKGGQKAKKGEIAMRKGVRSGAGEGAAEAMTSRAAAKTPRLAMKTKARKKGSAMKLKDEGMKYDEAREKKYPGINPFEPGKKVKEGTSDFKRPPIKRTGNTTRLKKENKKYLPEGQRTQIMKKEARRKDLKSQAGVRKRSVYPGKRRPMTFEEIGRR